MCGAPPESGPPTHRTSLARCRFLVQRIHRAVTTRRAKGGGVTFRLMADRTGSTARSRGTAPAHRDRRPPRSAPAVPRDALGLPPPPGPPPPVGPRRRARRGPRDSRPRSPQRTGHSAGDALRAALSRSGPLAGLAGSALRRAAGNLPSFPRRTPARETRPAAPQGSRWLLAPRVGRGAGALGARGAKKRRPRQGRGALQNFGGAEIQNRFRGCRLDSSVSDCVLRHWTSRQLKDID